MVSSVVFQALEANAHDKTGRGKKKKKMYLTNMFSELRDPSRQAPL